jgi:predicted PurR-regulated permease PerM
MEEIIMSTDFLYSVLEEMTVINNINSELRLNEKELMIQEHFSILNESSNFGSKVKDSIKFVLKKLGELVIRIKNWIVQKYTSMMNQIKKRGISLKGKTVKSEATFKSQYDLEVTSKRLEYASNGINNLLQGMIHELLMYNVLYKARDKNTVLSKLKSSVEHSEKERKEVSEDLSKVFERKETTYSASQVEKIKSLHDKIVKKSDNFSEHIKKLIKEVDSLKDDMFKLDVNKEQGEIVYEVAVSVTKITSSSFQMTTSLVGAFITFINETQKVINGLTEE